MRGEKDVSGKGTIQLSSSLVKIRMALQRLVLVDSSVALSA